MKRPTIFGIFFTPVFYYVIRWLTSKRSPVTPGDGHPSADAVVEPPLAAVGAH